MSYNVTELREQRGQLLADAKKILDKADLEKRSLTETENQAFDDLHNKAETINQTVIRSEKQYQAEQEIGEIREKDKDIRRAVTQENEVIRAINTDKYQDAFSDFLIHGIDGMKSENRAQLESKRALAEGTGSTGGYLAPTSFTDELEKKLISYVGVRQAPCRKLRTADGRVIPWPVQDDTGNVGELLAENVATAMNADPSFAAVNINAYIYSSKLVLVPNNLLTDSVVDLQGDLADMLATRIGRQQNADFTTGSGSGQPMGIVTGASDSGLTSETTTLETTADADLLIDLATSVDPVYRNSPNAGYMMKDNALQALRKIKDSNNRYQFQPSLTLGVPSTFNGFPIYINQGMAYAAAAKAVLFGDFSKYFIRDVNDLTIVRTTERFIEYFQTGFLASQRSDGRVINSAAISYLTLHA
jgi:HK97 family phage major capsid protein